MHLPTTPAAPRPSRALLIALASLVVLLLVLTLLGYILGHGWLFSNLPAEHKVSEFYTRAPGQGLRQGLRSVRK